MNKKSKEIKIVDPGRIIIQQAKATVKNLIDALVEIITNSDDSYIRLESNGINSSGKIGIFVTREKGGQCKDLVVIDEASGMDKNKLEEVIQYAGETSGFSEGKGVRGLLGRGLKESIISLGEGKIYTRKNGKISCVKIYINERGAPAYYSLGKEEYSYEGSAVSDFLKSKKNGTLVKIKVKNEKIIIPEHNKFEEQLSSHYALRDIHLSEKREVNLEFENLGRTKATNSGQVLFKAPDNYEADVNLIIDEKIILPKYNHEIELKIWESTEQLTARLVGGDPFSKAGILIKTEGAVLDNQLFKFDGKDAAYYFHGSLYCKGISEKIREAAKRKSESEIIDLTRNGLVWQSDYCREIAKVVEKYLGPLVEKKDRELQKTGIKKTTPYSKIKIKSFCALLNKLAKLEMESDSIISGSGEIENLTIVPAFANVQIDQTRTLSIYAPKTIIENSKKIIVESDNSGVKISKPGSKSLGLQWTVSLEDHPDNNNVLYKSIKVKGKVIGAEALITCRLDNHRASSVIRVVEELVDKKTSSRNKRKGRRGFINDIKLNTISNPTQRVSYQETDGEIDIFVNFPGVRKYLSGGFGEAYSRDDSRAIFAELICEAFCRTIARKKVEELGFPGSPEEQIDTFNSEVNSLQRKYSEAIHDFASKWKK